MRVTLSRDASAFLRHEQRYLEQVNPRAAITVLQRLRAVLRLLAEQPRAGSPYQALKGRRRLVSGNYVIDYRIGEAGILVSQIRHGRQDSPELEASKDNIPED